MIRIAIDGPAGSGKSTVAKRIAEQLDITYLDTGAMYRAATLFYLEHHIAASDIDEVNRLLKEIHIEINGSKVILNGKDVSSPIRAPFISENVSSFAAIRTIREKMVIEQQAISKSTDIIMDGRDIGTKVLPHAEYKYFLTATVEERAMRRFKELTQNGIDIAYDDLKRDIERRDQLDTDRDESPLVQAEDAKLIDTTGLTIDEVVTLIVKQINK